MKNEEKEKALMLITKSLTEANKLGGNLWCAIVIDSDTVVFSEGMFSLIPSGGVTFPFSDGNNAQLD